MPMDISRSVNSFNQLGTRYCDQRMKVTPREEVALLSHVFFKRVDRVIRVRSYLIIMIIGKYLE